MNKDTGPESGAKGVIEDIKGKAKEVAGEVTGNESLENEGRAQQDKAQAQRDVAKQKRRRTKHEAKHSFTKPSGACTRTTRSALG